MQKHDIYSFFIPNPLNILLFLENKIDSDSILW